VCFPDSTVTKALSAAVLGLPSRFQLNTSGWTRVTTSRQALALSGSLYGPHVAVSPSTVVGGY